MLLALAGPVAAVALVGGCGDATPTVDRGSLEEEISTQLKAQDTAPDGVDCPGDLTGEVGTTMRCTVTQGGDDVPVEVRVTGVDGDRVDFDIAPTVSSSSLEQQVSSALEQQVGAAPDDVTCPDDLVGTVGETTRCTLTAGADRLGVTVRVTEVEGASVNFDVEVDDTAESGSAS